MTKICEGLRLAFSMSVALLVAVLFVASFLLFFGSLLYAPFA